MASSSSAPQEIPLSRETMSSFKPAKVFKDKHLESGRQFTSLSFSDSGEFALTTAEDDMLQVFNVQTGKHQRHLASKKYGCNLARFAHSRSAAVYASTKEDGAWDSDVVPTHTDALRHLDLNTNGYIRYYKGHTKTCVAQLLGSHAHRVVSLEVSPCDDRMLSSAPDDSVRLWDLRTAAPTGFLPIIGHPCACFDPVGLVFAVAMSFPEPTITMYDLRNFDKDPFGSFTLAETFRGAVDQIPRRLPIITSMAFSNDNKHLLVGTSGNEHYVLDAYDMFVKARLIGHQGLESLGEPLDPNMPPRAGASGCEVSWTPDARYVVSGSMDGKVLIWDVAPPEGSEDAKSMPPYGSDCILAPLKAHDGHQGRPSRVVAFNPRFATMASAGTELAFWLPSA